MRTTAVIWTDMLPDAPPPGKTIGVRYSAPIRATPAAPAPLRMTTLVQLSMKARPEP